MAEEKPSWIKMKPAELEKLVIDLAKKGETPAKIGIILRDVHGIPKSKLISKRIVSILKENKIPYKTEAEIAQENLEKMKKHIGKHKHDKNILRAFNKQFWLVKKLKSL